MKKFLKPERPVFSVGDTVKVSQRIAEGGKFRTQVFQGILIANKGTGIDESITVRKISYGEGIEKVFLVHSPLVENIEVIRRGKVRRSKLYYLRGRKGKQFRVKTLFDKKSK